MEFFVDGEVGLPKQGPAFAVADDDVFDIQVGQHGGGDFPRVGAAGFPVEVLGAHGHPAVLEDLYDGRDIHIGDAQNDAAPLHPGQGPFETLGKELGLRGGFVHLPVASDDGFAIFSVHLRLAPGYLSSRQAIPGRVSPSKNSREAPPPVEMWVN